MFGITGREATPAEQERLEASKSLVYEGLQAALQAGAPPAAAGVLVDEEMGAAVARAAKEAGLLVAMPVERSEQDLFDFEYGEDFAAHIEAFDPDFAKALVRWNPADDPEIKQLQAGRLRRLGDRLHERGRKYLFELLVPATPRQLALVGGNAADYDAHVRPYPDAGGHLRDPGSRHRARRVEDRRASTPPRTAPSSRPWPAATAATRSRRWSWAAAPTTPGSSTGCAPPPRCPDTPASPSAAPSGGTRSQAWKDGTLPGRKRPTAIGSVLPEVHRRLRGARRASAPRR